MSSQSARTVMRALAQNPSLRKEVLDLIPHRNTTSSVTAAGDLFYRELTSAFAAPSAAAGMQAATARLILAPAALLAPGTRFMSTMTNKIKSRPNTFFKEEQSLNAPRRPKSSIDMTSADRQAAPYTSASMSNPQARSMMSVMSSTSTSPSTSTSTKTATATAMFTPSTTPKTSEVFLTHRPGFYSVSAIRRDTPTLATPAPVTTPASKTSFSKVMQTTRPGFYGVSAFVRPFSTTTRNKEFFVGINADWPAEQAPPTPTPTPTETNMPKVQKTDNIDLPEDQPTWRPVDDGKVLSESEARIPQNENERYVSALP